MMLIMSMIGVTMAYIEDVSEIQCEILEYQTQIDEISELKIQLHILANMFRTYTYLNNGFDEYLSVKWRELEIEEQTLVQKITGLNEKIETIECVQQSSANVTKEPFIVSNLSEQQITLILSDTGLSECGEYFREMEQIHSVNAIFAIAVAFHESGYGSSNLAKNNNNFFGFKGNNGWMSFGTKRECILYFGELMNRKTYKNKTIDEIAVKYCNVAWANNIDNMMDIVIIRLG